MPLTRAARALLWQQYVLQISCVPNFLNYCLESQNASGPFSNVHQWSPSAPIHSLPNEILLTKAGLSLHMYAENGDKSC